jgi:predicted GNAT superfamily acetyltransferase
LKVTLRLITDPEEFEDVYDLQRIVWPGDETDAIPTHLLIASVRNGGLVIGAFVEEGPGQTKLGGFVFGFPGFYATPDGPRLLHCSHNLGVHPDFRDQGLGYKLKRAQWQMVRHQGIDRIIWTYDPLLSRNAYLNIAKLGAVCSNYVVNYYGEMHDNLNVGLPSDRLQVDWWVNTPRVNQRLSRHARQKLNAAHFFDAGAQVVNPSGVRPDGLPFPIARASPMNFQTGPSYNEIQAGFDLPAFVLVEIPADFLSLKSADQSLALQWRLHIRDLLPKLFERGYLVTDFIYIPGSTPRSFYVLSHGDSTL